MKTTTKKDFIDTLKYGKFYVHIKKHIDTLCEAVTKLDGKYSINYIARDQLFIINIYVPAWSHLLLHIPNINSVDKSLDMTAHQFATLYLDSSSICWNTTNCQVPGRAEYHISHYW